MKTRFSVVVSSGFAVTVLAWVFALRSPSWAAPITEPMFILGKLLVLTLTPTQHAPDLGIIVLGYVVNFIFTWAVMAFAVGFTLRSIAKGRMSA